MQECHGMGAIDTRCQVDAIRKYMGIPDCGEVIRNSHFFSYSGFSFVLGE